MKLVQKYGGEYLREWQDLNTIADFAAKTRESGTELVLVIPALHAIAEPMTSRIRNLGLQDEISRGKLDLLFSTAEGQTALLLAAALEKRGVEARAINSIRGNSLSALDIEDGKHELVMDEIEETLSKGQIPVIAGYQGIGNYNAADVKGRYGAAATAVAIAAALDADCQLFGNTKGIFTRREGGHVIPVISYEEAMETIQLSDCDLESRAFELASTYGVKVYVGPAFEEEEKEGTYIMNRNMIIQEGAITGITTSDDIAIYTISQIPYGGETTAELLEVLGDIGVNIDMITQQADSEDTFTVSFSCGKDKAEDIDSALSINPRLCRLMTNKQENLSLLSLVGVGMASHVGVAGKVFGTLAEKGIPYYHITTSEISISTTIDSRNREEAIIALGEAFRL